MQAIRLQQAVVGNLTSDDKTPPAPLAQHIGPDGLRLLPSSTCSDDTVLNKRALHAVFSLHLQGHRDKARLAHR